jgi:putative SOS response-associated peptidase YedK
VTGETVESYTILTTDPNELISRERIHDRMPVILSPTDYGRWLNPGDPARPPTDLLRPFPAEEMTCWQLGKDVGNVKNDRPDLIDPVPQTLGLFA